MSLLERLEKVKMSQTSLVTDETNNEPVYFDKYLELKEKIHHDVIELINTQATEGRGENDDIDLQNMIERLISQHSNNLPRSERSKVAREIYDDVAGLGPLEPLLNDETISEIMVNGAHSIYVERKGKIELTDTFFRDDNHVLTIIDRIVSSIGRRCDESNPMVDARLHDGSRVNAVINPIALKGPSITIRKFSSKPLKISDLISFNSISFAMASFLEACVKGRCNIIVSGGTGSGKTTLLNVLSSFIPDGERIVTIEDAAELQLMQHHVVTLESRPSNSEGRGNITIRDLVRNSLRMRPDRIIVGEVRSGETLDMLQAMNTGHDGSLTTVHANSPRDVVSRLETMVLMSGMELPVKAIREQISSGIDLIVQQSRFRDGSRKITSISEVIGMEGDIITLQDIFTFRQEGIDGVGRIKGNFEPTGIQPHLLDKLKNNGISVKSEWFARY